MVPRKLKRDSAVHPPLEKALPPTPPEQYAQYMELNEELTDFEDDSYIEQYNEVRFQKFEDSHLRPSFNMKKEGKGQAQAQAQAQQQGSKKKELNQELDSLNTVETDEVQGFPLNNYKEQPRLIQKEATSSTPISTYLTPEQGLNQRDSTGGRLPSPTVNVSSGNGSIRRKPPPPDAVDEDIESMKDDYNDLDISSGTSTGKRLSTFSMDLVTRGKGPDMLKKMSFSSLGSKLGSNIKRFSTSSARTFERHDQKSNDRLSVPTMNDNKPIYTTDFAEPLARPFLFSSSSPPPSSHFSPPAPPPSSSSVEPQTPSHEPSQMRELMQYGMSPFWKYHILKLGKDLYLTTNPGAKHLYCRTAPGFYVEVKALSHDTKVDRQKGYTLVFKHVDATEHNSMQTFMQITKAPERDGGYFTVRLPKDLTNTSEEIRTETLKGFENKSSEWFNAVCFPQPIQHDYFPFDELKKRNVKFMQNYEVKDFKGVYWNIGSIPRVRTSKLNSVKLNYKKQTRRYQKLHQHHQQYQQHQHHRYDHQTFLPQDHNDEINIDETLKLTHKRNIYFHQNYIGRTSEPRYKETDFRKIYDHELYPEFPPVLCMFRPYVKQVASRLTDSLKNKADTGSRYIPSSQADQIFPLTTDRKKKYYKGSEGFSAQNEADDTPDENKMGWITVYEDLSVFGGSSNQGMFDFVVGLTLAVGFDNSF